MFVTQTNLFLSTLLKSTSLASLGCAALFFLKPTESRGRCSNRSYNHLMNIQQGLQEPTNLEPSEPSLKSVVEERLGLHVMSE